ncbi:hypothetical protein PLESTF_000207300 [Pleodorina starrii]|nr:hypothetical protein PLESTM_000242600 [Pleodorina starrii]GLC64785.1 hypothetical protein PLESTF_000207300 [Pleodorina starrii]
MRGGARNAGRGTGHHEMPPPPTAEDAARVMSETQKAGGDTSEGSEASRMQSAAGRLAQGKGI